MSGSRQSRSRSASVKSVRSSRTSSFRTAAQHTSNNGRRSSRRNSSVRQRSRSPSGSVSSHPARSPSPSQSRAPNRKRFGLNVPTNLPRVPGRFDFEDKYPEDPTHEEMGPNARLWRAFLDECEVFDMDMVTESRDGLDLLLVFAGLFSAVLTTFVTQTSQALSTNFPAVSSSLMVEMVALQRAQINNAPIDDILPAETHAGPSGFDVWVNALWFTSLALSLGTALLAVLVKQWLYQYMSMISGTARDRSLIRYYRFEGLQKWHVLTIIGTLPIVLHIALGLFLAGLVVFLIPLNIPLACVVGFVTLLVYTLYAVSNILPLVYIQCPYRTPFSDILNVMLRAVRTLPSLVVKRVHKLLPSFGDDTNTAPAADDAFRTLKDTERSAATHDAVAEEVALRALLWLYEMTSNPPTKRIIQESLGCLSDDISKRPKELQADLEQALGGISPTTYDYDRRSWFRSILSGQERRAGRILRAVRDPFAARHTLEEPNAPWRVDVTDTELSLQIVTSILIHAPGIRVEMDSVKWKLPSLLQHLINWQFSPAAIRLPPRLWTFLIVSISSNLEDYSSGFIVELCSYALKNFDRTTQPTITPPFAGPVVVTHRTVPLFQLVADLLVRRLEVPHTTDTFESEPLTKLFTIYDYVAWEKNLNSDASTVTPEELSTVWGTIHRLGPANLSDNDKAILCRRVENVILETTFDGDLWDGRFSRTQRCYTHAILVYERYKLSVSHRNGSRAELFEKLLSDLCASLARGSRNLLYRISTFLQTLLNQHEHTPVYSPVFCVSPLFTTRTTSSVAKCREFLYPVAFAFMEAAAAGDIPRDIVLQSLFAEPQRFYTFCWILTLGGFENDYDDWEEHRRASLLQWARIDPTHVVWESRAYYMNMDPRDWPYLRLLDEELDEYEQWIQEALVISRAILDGFFDNASSPANPTAIQETPSQNNPVPQIISSDNLNPSSGNPRWRHIRQLVSGTRAFLGLSSVSHSSSSNATNVMELGLERGPSGVESGEIGPQAEPDAHILYSTTRQSSRSSGADTARSFHSCSNSNVPRPDHQSLPVHPPSAFPMVLPSQIAELSTVSAPLLETRTREELEDVAEFTPLLYEPVRTTPSTRSSRLSGSPHLADLKDITGRASDGDYPTSFASSSDMISTSASRRNVQ